MRIKIRVDPKPLENYLNDLIKEIENASSEMTIEILKNDMMHRAIWIDPTNNVNKLVDLDLIMSEDSGLETWELNLTLNPVNIQNKNAEIRANFKKNPHFEEVT